MDRKIETELIDELLALKAEGAPYLDEQVAQSPVDHYLDTARFDAEQTQIFARLPAAIAHSSELPDANSFVRRTLAGRSILLTRDAHGTVRAFLNVCRHRGTQLVDDDAGCKARFSCPYHAWTYGNDGQLLAAPHFDSGFPENDKSAFSLVSLPCRELFGFVWVIADADAAGDVDMDTYFGPLRDELAALDIADMVIAQEDVQLRQSNWKILVEGGIESYHFKVAHRDTIGPYFEDNLSSYRCYGPHMRSVLPRVSMAELDTTRRDSWRLRDHANLVYTLFPMMQMLVQQDHIVWITSTPVAVDQTRLRLATLVPAARRDETDYWARNHTITITTLNEDFDIGESIQANMASGANRQLTFGRYEGALARFNETVNAQLAGTPSAAE